MSKTIWALLVGIDDYQSPVPPLRGCVNDIEAIHGFLQERAKDGKYTLEPLKLLDAQATRENIIGGFRNHLSKAKAGDVALFYYSGHGSQEQAAEEFWPIEPDRLNETLVTYDSRRTDSQGKEVYDLADKELAQLIAEVANKNPHFLAVLDCCHSGSGTREAREYTARLANTDERIRPISSYLREAQPRDISQPAPSLKRGQHVLFAACRPEQLAKEATFEGRQRGAFSAALVEALEQPGSLSYRDLFKRIENQIKNSVEDQNPQLELLAGQADALFLGGAVPERPPYFTLRHENKTGWVIDGGAIHGLLKDTRLAVFAAGSAAEVLNDPNGALATAEVSKVLASKSQVGLEGNLQPGDNTSYWAVVTGFPVEPLRVLLEGEDAALAALRSQLKGSLFASETAQNPEYRVLVRGGAFWTTLPASDRPLTDELKVADAASVGAMAKRLEAIARWRNTKDLQNPTSQIAGQIQMEVLGEDGKPLSGDARLIQTQDAEGEPNFPSIRVRLTNRSSKNLFCTLLSLSESFAIDPLVEGSNRVQPLGKGETLELNQGEPMLFAVPDELWELGITERTDVLKLIVCTEEFDAERLQQDKQGFPTRRDVTRSVLQDHPLQQLMKQVATREPVKKPDKLADWCTQSFNLTIVRPQVAQPISPNVVAEVGGAGAKIKVKPHKQLKAKASVSSKTHGTRSLEGFTLPPVLRDHPEWVQPVQFSNSRSVGGALEVFELSEIENPESVTPENPLELELPTSFDPSTEQIIPLAIHKDKDGKEYFLPLGFAEPAATRSTDAGATVKIEYLPNLPDVSAEERARSLFNSLRMMFLKIAGEKLGVEVKNQLLSAVEVSAGARPNYIGDAGEVKKRVEALQPGDNVLLYVHGILGKTNTIVGSVVSTPGGATEPIGQHYKLILAYDYENLNTPIKETGKRLREKLIEVGLGPNHGKNLHIVAHSMGGLVSRWMIEHEGGGADQIVQRLVMLGTPNGGSPWLNLTEWVTHLLTLAVNGLAPAAWVSAILNGAVMLLRSTTTTTEMKLNSPFIQELGTNLADGVKYSFIAGDASLQGSKERQSFVSKLFDLALHGASNQLFQGKPNDLAASVESVLSPLPSSEPKPQPIGSDHFSYFVPEVGLGSLAKVLE